MNQSEAIIKLREKVQSYDRRPGDYLVLQYERAIIAAARDVANAEDDIAARIAELEAKLWKCRLQRDTCLGSLDGAKKSCEGYNKNRKVLSAAIKRCAASFLEIADSLKSIENGLDGSDIVDAHTLCSESYSECVTRLEDIKELGYVSTDYRV